MSEMQWQALLEQMAQAAAPAARLCVGCWYKTQHLPFPAEASSSLCETCAQETRAHVSLLVPVVVGREVRQ